MKQKPKIIVICGPTATGKSDLAVELALKFKGEIISADSRQVYRGLDIGSGKITKKEMKGVPHHLLDVSNPNKTYTVENFKNDGKKEIGEILKRNRLPIICGGTGFYIDALVYNEEFPAVPPDRKLRLKLSKKTPETLMKVIRKLDSRRARMLDPKNKVRIIRAIEVARALGKVPKIKREKQYETLWIGLTTDRETLKNRIGVRLHKRIKGGMIDEVKRLQKAGVSWKRLHALGLEYRYVSLYLQNKISKEEMLSRLEQEIANYSKRQMTWFLRNKNIVWLKPGESKKAVKIVQKFVK